MNATEAFCEWLESPGPGGEPLPKFVGETAIVRAKRDYGLRHRADLRAEDLRLLGSVEELRLLALRDGEGAYRALRTGRGMVRGWRLGPVDVHGLRTAVEVLYPAAVGLWRRWTARQLEIVSYREASGRQSGRYRVAASLAREEIEGHIRGVCEGRCLRSRHWPVIEGEAIFASARSGEFPLVCPAPCAFFMEQARGGAPEPAED